MRECRKKGESDMQWEEFAGSEWGRLMVEMAGAILNQDWSRARETAEKLRNLAICEQLVADPSPGKPRYLYIDSHYQAYPLDKVSSIN